MNVSSVAFGSVIILLVITFICTVVTALHSIVIGKLYKNLSSQYLIDIERIDLLIVHLAVSEGKNHGLLLSTMQGLTQIRRRINYEKKNRSWSKKAMSDL